MLKYEIDAVRGVMLREIYNVNDRVLRQRVTDILEFLFPDYLIQCDGENNEPWAIDAGGLIVDIFDPSMYGIFSRFVLGPKGISLLEFPDNDPMDFRIMDWPLPL